MATLDQLSAALVNADKAGDVQAARTLAAEINRLRTTANPNEFAFDPARDMSKPQQFFAAMGKSVADTARGIGQAIGVTDRGDVAESRRLDAPLMKTGAGTAGNITGSVLSLLPTAFIPGAATLPGAAAIGGATGLLAPSESTEETLKNTGIGALAAPAAIMLGRSLAAGYQGAKGLVEPFYKSGQDRIAARVLNASATDPAKASAALKNAKPLVPGSNPTVAQAAGDPGLAQLERTLLNNPEMAGPLQTRFAEQRAARSQALGDIAGTDEYYNAIKEGRKVFAKEDYAKALEQPIDLQMAKAIAPQLESLMGRPSIKNAQKVAQDLARESDIALNDFTSLQGLDWLKKALDNQISKAKLPGSSIGKAELEAITQTKDDLLNTIEALAPGYRDANDSFAKMSKQVNSMDVARALQDKLYKAGSEYGSAREMGDAYKAALSNAVESVKKQTGMNKSLSEIMPTADIQALENIARDISRKQFAEGAGRATGSPTAQNMASQNMLRRLLGPTGMPESWAENTMLQTLMRPLQFAAKAGEPRIQNRLAELLLDPAEAQRMMALQELLPMSARIGMGAQPFIPAASMGLLTSNRAQ